MALFFRSLSLLNVNWLAPFLVLNLLNQSRVR
ncbi:hypothetical protein Thiosp_04437 [Thiorhodovibrio litoralis]|nr:hypothetical protein Thiosp_04437 [Thiorhodovibrio litoralis]